MEVVFRRKAPALIISEAISMLRKVTLTATLILYLTIPNIVFGEEYTETSVLDSSVSRTIWKGWNVSGTLHFKIRASEGNSCVTLWWNHLGYNSNSFNICDGDTLDYKVPAFVFSRLKARSPYAVAIAVSTNANVNQNIELCGKIIQC